MQNQQVIENVLEGTKVILRTAENRHSRMDQIEMLSAKGSEIREDISDAKATISILKWVLEDTK